MSFEGSTVVVIGRHCRCPTGDRHAVLGIGVRRQYAAPRMTDGGSITFCSGTSSTRPRPGGSPIAAASCAAVEGLARSLAFELAPIRVNAIIPGLIDTPLVSTGLGEHRDAFYAAMAAQLPARRVGTAGDVAHAVMFLMENGYVSGISLPVDGGRLVI